MSTHMERARTRRPITWLTVVGVLLLPVLIGGVLVASLYNPTDRLDAMSAAIVNNDTPVSMNGQLVPLGRQLTAGLVKGSKDAASNLDWTISNTKDAAAGLKDGTYKAVVTIPKDFSAAALSPGKAIAGDDVTARRATIHVTTAPDARVIDDAITAQLAATAAQVTGAQLSTATLQNVLVGFTTLGDKLGQAASGATSLAGGITTLADGATTLAGGADGIAQGTHKLADGAGTWAGGATTAARGMHTLATGAQTLATTTKTLAAGVSTVASGLSQVPPVPAQAVDAAQQLAANAPQLKAGLTGVASGLDAAVAQCRSDAADPALCDTLQQLADQSHQTTPTLVGVLDNAGAIAGGATALSRLPQAAAGLTQLAGGMTQVAGGMTQLADGAGSAAFGVSTLAAGAQTLASGAQQASSGAATWAAGAQAWAGGAGQTEAGATGIADGLHQASGSLPSFTTSKAKKVAAVVADPVAATGAGSAMFGTSAIPLLAMVALWFGGLGSFVAFQAVSRRALVSRRPSWRLALRALAPAAGIGAAQGLLVAGIVELAASYDPGTWTLFAVSCMVAGVAFAAVNQALVAVLGGAGRWVAALVGVLAIATGIISTVPGFFVAVAGVMPTAPALSAGLAALTGAGGAAAGIAGLVVWAVLAFGATVLVVMRTRTTTVRALVEDVPLAA